MASKLVTGSEKYEKTLNRIFNKLVKSNLFNNLRELLTNMYINKNIIKNLKIDSTDIMNGNCNKKFLGKSLKLNKQAIKSTFIIDSNKIPLAYSLEIPTKHDSKVGYDLLINSRLSKYKTKRIYLAGDKGYLLANDKYKNLIKTKNILMVNPKKQYKKKMGKNKYYKKKLIRHSKQMKSVLQSRIEVEHFNSVIHRSFKRLDKIYDKSLTTFRAFMDLALSTIIIKFMNK